jgi:uncharacterized protein YjbI with pentapeptide repeats
MKKLTILWVALLGLSAVALVSCKEESVDKTPIIVAEGEPTLIEIGPEAQAAMEIPIASQGIAFTVADIRVDANWISPTDAPAATRALEKSSLWFKVNANQTTNVRSATIEIEGTDLNILVRQSGQTSTFKVGFNNDNELQYVTEPTYDGRALLSFSVSSGETSVALRVLEGNPAVTISQTDPADILADFTPDDASGGVYTVKVKSAYNKDAFDYSKNRFAYVVFTNADKSFTQTITIHQQPRVAGIYTNTTAGKLLELIDATDPIPECYGTTDVKVSGPINNADLDAISARFENMVNLDLSGAEFKEAWTNGTSSNGTFLGKAALEKVILPTTSLTAIGAYAFYNCAKLKDVNFADVTTLTSIGKCAFGYCDFINITIPRTINNIGEQAFEHNHHLKTLTFDKPDEKEIIPGTDTSIKTCTIGKNAFNITATTTLTTDTDYGVLEGLVIPNWVGSIGDNAFKLTMCNTPGGASLTIGSGVNYIGSAAFSECRALTSVTFLDGSDIVVYQGRANNLVTGAGTPSYGMFYCSTATPATQLKTITIPARFLCQYSTTARDTKYGVPVGFIAGVTSLEEIIVAENVELVHGYAFGYTNATLQFTNLKKLVLPSTLTNLYGRIFNGQEALFSNLDLYVPENCTIVDSNTTGASASYYTFISSYGTSPSITVTLNINLIKTAMSNGKYGFDLTASAQ